MALTMSARLPLLVSITAAPRPGVPRGKFAGRKCEPAPLLVRLTGCGIATIFARSVQRTVKTATRPVNVPGESGEAWRLTAIVIRRVRAIATRTMA
jgi:hypothetical protein